MLRAGPTWGWDCPSAAAHVRTVSLASVSPCLCRVVQSFSPEERPAASVLLPPRAPVPVSWLVAAGSLRSAAPPHHRQGEAARSASQFGLYLPCVQQCSPAHRFQWRMPEPERMRKKTQPSVRCAAGVTGRTVCSSVTAVTPGEPGALLVVAPKGPEPLLLSLVPYGWEVPQEALCSGLPPLSCGCGRRGQARCVGST